MQEFPFHLLSLGYGAGLCLGLAVGMAVSPLAGLIAFWLGGAGFVMLFGAILCIAR